MKTANSSLFKPNVDNTPITAMPSALVMSLRGRPSLLSYPKSSRTSRSLSSVSLRASSRRFQDGNVVGNRHNGLNTSTYVHVTYVPRDRLFTSFASPWTLSSSLSFAPTAASSSSSPVVGEAAAPAAPPRHCVRPRPSPVVGEGSLEPHGAKEGMVQGAARRPSLRRLWEGETHRLFLLPG